LYLGRQIQLKNYDWQDNQTVASVNFTDHGEVFPVGMYDAVDIINTNLQQIFFVIY
jgi:hypothetical protein